MEKNRHNRDDCRYCWIKLEEMEKQVNSRKDNGCQYGRIKFEEMEKRIKDLSSGCDWGRTVLKMLEEEMNKIEISLKVLEGRVWKIVVGLQIFTILLNIILVVFK